MKTIKLDKTFTLRYLQEDEVWKLFVRCLSDDIYTLLGVHVFIYLARDPFGCKE